jgi:putative membrane protein
MWQHIVVALKGMAFGLSNIVPGMTGGAILIVLGIYGQFVDALGNLATNKARRREYLIFLGALGLGAVIAMVGLSRALTWLLDWRPVLLTFLFKGLLLGTIPALFRLHNDMRITPGRALAALLGLAVVVALRALERQNLHAELLTDSRSLLGIAYVLAAACVAGAANVTPGISGSYVFLLAGTYRPILDALSALARLDIHWHVLAPTAAGAAIGIVACSKLIDTALKRASGLAAYAILGLLLGSVYGLWPAGALQQEDALLLALCLAAGIAIAALLGRRGAEGGADRGTSPLPAREARPQRADGEPGV